MNFLIEYRARVFHATEQQPEDTLQTTEEHPAALPAGSSFSVTNCAPAYSKHHKSIGLSRASLDYKNTGNELKLITFADFTI